MDMDAEICAKMQAMLPSVAFPLSVQASNPVQKANDILVL